MNNEKKLVVAAQIGNCVHVAGGIHFLNLAADQGYETMFLGPAVSIEKLFETIREKRPWMITIGYRLTPENAVPLVDELIARADTLDYKPRWIFGGTKPVSERIRPYGFFEKIYDGTEDIDESIAFLKGQTSGCKAEMFEDDLISRAKMKSPYPLLRHHFGLPSFEETAHGIAQIADSKVLDIISLGPDQNTQQYFFRPDERNKMLDGAGGVHISSEDDFITLKQACQRGNYPLLRCYSGTADVFPFAEVLKKTINNAWCAVPLCWYNELDGRGSRTVECSVAEAQKLMAWHGENNIPVEANEPHHWALRDSHDSLVVAMSYIAAYNAKKYGVKNYISQMMFNVPSMLSFSMDLAKARAQIQLCSRLEDSDFKIYKQTRAGLPFLSADLDTAKGQLAASTYLQMSVKPDIIHVVGYSEAEHAATAQVAIESCKLVRGVVSSALCGLPAYENDESIISRTDELVSEALYLIEFIKERYSCISSDPLADPQVIADCIRTGILDAPHIVKNEKFRGKLQTRITDGKCLAFDIDAGRAVSERERLGAIAFSKAAV